MTTTSKNPNPERGIPIGSRTEDAVATAFTFTAIYFLMPVFMIVMGVVLLITGLVCFAPDFLVAGLTSAASHPHRPAGIPTALAAIPCLVLWCYSSWRILKCVWHWFGWLRFRHVDGYQGLFGPRR